MRKLGILLLAALSVACAKEPEFETVTFEMGRVQSGSLTKVSTDAVSSALAATAPVGPFTLTATSKTNSKRIYTITTGQSVTMAVDDYTITGSGAGEEITPVTEGYIYKSPKWSVNKDVSVSSSGQSFTLNASYPCVAFVIDKSVTARLIFHNGNSLVSDYSYGGTDAVGVVYASGYWTHATQLWMAVRPVDEMNYETTEYNITSREYDDTYCVQNGHWYNFLPGSLELTSGTFGVTFPGWEAGQ